MLTHKSIGYSGRLGNQMFQYAALKAAALRLGVQCFLPSHQSIKQDGVYDLTNHKWIPYRLELVDCFEVTTPIQDNNLPNQYSEKAFTYESSINIIQSNTALEGYFQSYKYFQDFEEDIRREFTFKPSILTKCESIIAQYNNPISIHIRRGDYVNHPSYWTVTPEYLTAALEEVAQPDATYLIFSDDFDWCKEVFGDEFVFMQGNNQFEDLCLMSLCDHNVIANSSYSWWGAWLNNNPDKIVVAPSKWFTDNKSLNDLYPNNWIII